MSGAAAYLQLTKPRLVPLVLLSGLPALVMAAGGWPDASTVVLVLAGTALAGGAANSLNSYLECDLDAIMERTRSRPLPAGELPPWRALCFGLALGVVGPGLLWAHSGPAAALVALAGILFYVFVYTLWLKPRTSAAVIAGGVAGAVSPLIADVAVSGQVGAAGAIVFSIIFVWQPPHFWAISLYRRQEYEAAGFPLLVSRVGNARTCRSIVLWIAALVPLTLAPVALGMLGAFYAVAALGLGAWFLASGIRLLREQTAAAARLVFRVSLVYLMGVLASMIVDLAWSGFSLA